MVILDVARLNLLLPTPGGRRLHALREISFKLQRGSCLGVVGESGCGKSLLALSLLGLQPAGSQVSGSIRLHTHEVLGQSEAAWQKLRGNRPAKPDFGLNLGRVRHFIELRDRHIRAILQQIQQPQAKPRPTECRRGHG